MPVTLRKRKAPEPAPAPAPKKAAAAPKAKAKAAPAKPVKAAPAKAVKEAAPAASKPVNGSAKTKKPAVDDVITITGFGGEVETNDGDKTTLEALLEESKAGVVLFTYPKASTPGCTTQVCLFRDSYEPLTAKGLAIYGLSADSPKANTTFKTKQKLPYTLLCDPQRTLIDAIGLKVASPAKTTRGVFVVDKKGRVLAAEPGGPAATLAVVKKLAEDLEDVNGGDAAEAAAANGDAKVEEPAAKETEETEDKGDEKVEKTEEKVEEKAEEKVEEKAEEKDEAKTTEEKDAA
ncbi:thioredoxin-like protein [Plectosphaerella plurivora]|uniref:thioredoxin-dependent peroxiredoxin n=1 Tax=Plectosphaerella plurivora TaxID=936078 RepID=A0A9P9AFE4_9PEZI|nr:thioredoxin-like protein [Plectosphaerella plurivora]